MVARAKTAKWLMLDDFGQARKATEPALDALDDVIMHRYAARAPMVITTNLRPEQIAERRGERVWSRMCEMAGSGVVELSGEDWRM